MQKQTMSLCHGLNSLAAGSGTEILHLGVLCLLMDLE